MLVTTSDPKTIFPYLQKIQTPKNRSHKGENGRVLVIGGSSLFHSASLWAAEIASHIVDIVHYSSTVENNEIFLSLKKKFRNGIVVPKKDIPLYAKEDDAILVGPGMVRGEKNSKFPSAGRRTNFQFQEIIKIKDESAYTRALTKYLLETYPGKQFVLDAGVLQMMDTEWLTHLKKKPVLTPHQVEFLDLFGVDVRSKNQEEKMKIVFEFAKKYQSVILLKSVDDIISDGIQTVRVAGGNPGLTKGGTGDLLAGLATSLAAKSSGFESAVVASFLLKKTGEHLSMDNGYWYNISDIIEKLPSVFKRLNQSEL